MLLLDGLSALAIAGLLSPAPATGPVPAAPVAVVAPRPAPRPAATPKPLVCKPAPAGWVLWLPGEVAPYPLYGSTVDAQLHYTTPDAHTVVLYHAEGAILAPLSDWCS